MHGCRSSGEAPLQCNYERNCKQAFKALQQIKKTRELAIPTQVLTKLKGNNLRYGELITYTIQRLRIIIGVRLPWHYLKEFAPLWLTGRPELGR